MYAETLEKIETLLGKSDFAAFLEAYPIGYTWGGDFNVPLAVVYENGTPQQYAEADKCWHLAHASSHLSELQDCEQHPEWGCDDNDKVQQSDLAIHHIVKSLAIVVPE